MYPITIKKKADIIPKMADVRPDMVSHLPFCGITYGKLMSWIIFYGHTCFDGFDRNVRN